MMIYVVMDYDCVSYAGTNFKDAVKVAKGDTRISVWAKGQWLGTKTQDGKWDFKTRFNILP